MRVLEDRGIRQLQPTSGTTRFLGTGKVTVLAAHGRAAPGGGTLLGSFCPDLTRRGETVFIGLVDFPFPRDAWAFLAMIAVLLLRPQGLLGR